MEELGTDVFMRHRILSFSSQRTMTVVRCNVYHISAVSRLTYTL